MLETWRWFGPNDPVTCSDIRQAGADGIVTALHSAAPGEVWQFDDIAGRKDFIEAEGLKWSVVESIPIHDAIKLGNKQAKHYIENWIQTMRNLAAIGLQVICYNFMPVVDWTRTDLRWKTRRGGLALRFDPVEFAAYDLFLLRRTGAAQDYTSFKLRLYTQEWTRPPSKGWNRLSSLDCLARECHMVGKIYVMLSLTMTE